MIWTEYMYVFWMFWCTIFAAQSRLLDLTTSLARHILDNLSRRDQRSSKDKRHGLQCHSVPNPWQSHLSCGVNVWQTVTHNRIDADLAICDNFCKRTYSKVKTGRSCALTSDPAAQWTARVWTGDTLHTVRAALEQKEPNRQNMETMT